LLQGKILLTVNFQSLANFCRFSKATTEKAWVFTADATSLAKNSAPVPF
jgi:hypothetical protein